MCGRRHFRALKRLFEAAGDEVCLYDIKDYAWHRGIQKEGAEGVIGYEKLLCGVCGYVALGCGFN